VSFLVHFGFFFPIFVLLLSGPRTLKPAQLIDLRKMSLFRHEFCDLTEEMSSLAGPSSFPDRQKQQPLPPSPPQPSFSLRVSHSGERSLDPAFLDGHYVSLISLCFLKAFPFPSSTGDLTEAKTGVLCSPTDPCVSPPSPKVLHQGLELTSP